MGSHFLYKHSILSRFCLHLPSTYFRTSHTFFAPSPHQVRTKSAPSSLHACIRLASSSHEVRSVSAAVSRFTCGKEVGLFYTDLTGSDVVIPALKRRKSEGRAKKERRRATNRFAKPFFSNNSFLQFFQCLIQVGFDVFDIFDAE